MHTFNVGTRLIRGELGNPLVLLPSVFCPCGYETVHSLQCSYTNWELHVCMVGVVKRWKVISLRLRLVCFHWFGWFPYRISLCSHQPSDYHLILSLVRPRIVSISLKKTETESSRLLSLVPNSSSAGGRPKLPSKRITYLTSWKWDSTINYSFKMYIV